METTPDHRPALRTWAFLLLSASLLAGCRSKPEPPPPDVVDVGPPSVSLLQLTPSRLALEWQFESGGDPFKGWKGKWLAVRVPRDAHVASINLRVSDAMRVSVSRDGTKLKEATLTREGVIPIDGPGGDYRLEVVGEPRTISNLDVLGQPGAERKSVSGLPPVRQGSLDMGTNVSGPWPTQDAFCEKRGGDRCNEPLDGNLARDRDGEHFAMHLKLGWFVVLDTKEVDVRSAHVERPEAGAPFMRFRCIERSAMGAMRIATLDLVVCRFVGDYVDCDERHTLGTWEGDPKPPASSWRPKDPVFLPDGGVRVDGSATRSAEAGPTE